MPESESFIDLLMRVRAGDPTAAEELVRRYEPAIRRAVRYRMTDHRLNPAFDSADVCQSVMLSFFVRAGCGEYDLDSPEQLQGLLLAMARNKLAMQIRRHRAQQRDVRRVADSPIEEHTLANADSTPSQHVSAKELLSEVRRRLSDEERQLVDLRNEGREWVEIAEQVGGTAEALRKKLARALDRVSRELGLDQRS